MQLTNKVISWVKQHKTVLIKEMSSQRNPLKRKKCYQSRKCQKTSDVVVHQLLLQIKEKKEIKNKLEFSIKTFQQKERRYRTLKRNQTTSKKAGKENNHKKIVSFIRFSDDIISSLMRKRNKQNDFRNKKS